MIKAKTVAFVAIMAALANVLSFPPFAIPLQFGAFPSSIHFFQLAVFISAILAGPLAGLITGTVGSLYMGITRIPFVIGGIAILGVCSGLIAKKFRPFIACLLAFLIQVPYVLITDYVWFTYFVDASSAATWTIIIPIIAILSLETLICAVLAEIIVHYIRKAGFRF